MIYPTDTVYGLGADPHQPAALRRIYEAKGRPDEKAIVWLVTSLNDARGTVDVTSEAQTLARHFWPGPLTMVLWRSEQSTDVLPTLAVRAPAHPAALALILAAGGAVATTSANLSGAPSTRSAAEAIAAVGRHVDLVIDGGPSPLGRESTIIDLTSFTPRIVRPGPITAAELADALGIAVTD